MRGASSEAPGRSSKSAQVTTTPTADTYTEKELVKMLSECRLKKKEALLTQNESQCDTISTKEQINDVVGPILMLQLQIKCVSVEAIADTLTQDPSQLLSHKLYYTR